MEDIHEKDLSQHASLKEFLGNLQRTQNQLSEDARNLTTALKGDSKKQGDWGEFILERTLEASGLVKGQEFTMQDTFDRQRPDAIIRLPEDRAIVIDSKGIPDRLRAPSPWMTRLLGSGSLGEHLQSMKSTPTSCRKRTTLRSNGLTLPISFLCTGGTCLRLAALKEDPNLYQYAFDRKIVLVTSTTLMATVKTVANLWKLKTKQARQRDRPSGRKPIRQLPVFWEALRRWVRLCEKQAEAHQGNRPAYDWFGQFGRTG